MLYNNEEFLCRSSFFRNKGRAVRLHFKISSCMEMSVPVGMSVCSSGFAIGHCVCMCVCVCVCVCVNASNGKLTIFTESSISQKTARTCAIKRPDCVSAVRKNVTIVKIRRETLVDCRYKKKERTELMTSVFFQSRFLLGIHC